MAKEEFILFGIVQNVKLLIKIKPSVAYPTKIEVNYTFNPILTVTLWFVKLRVALLEMFTPRVQLLAELTNDPIIYVLQN